MDTGFIVLGYNLIENNYLFGYVLSEYCPIIIGQYKIINCMYIENNLRSKYTEFSNNFYKHEIFGFSQNYIIFRYRKNLDCDKLCDVLQSIKLN